MVQISESIEIDRAASVIWDMIGQPERIVSCVPGAAVQPASEGGYTGTFSIRFGPTLVLFKGHCTISYDQVNRVCTIAGRGIDGRGASRAIGQGSVEVSPLSPSRSLIALKGEYSVNGPLQEFASSGGVYVARAMLQDFARNLAIMTSPVEPGANVSQPSTKPISGFALLWRSLASFVRSRFGKAMRRSS